MGESFPEDRLEFLRFLFAKKNLARTALYRQYVRLPVTRYPRKIV